MNIISIPDHPIRKLKETDKWDYLSGLGAFLFSVTQEEEVCFLFNAWCYSILGKHEDDYNLFKQSSVEAIKKAIRTENKWWQYFTVKPTFFFDCFYLLCLNDYISVHQVYELFFNCRLNSFQKRKLNEVYKAYVNDSIETIKGLDKSLLSHYNVNIQQKKSEPKKVLVVANVSAGKSMLINAIAGHRICKSTNMACTNRLHYIYNKPSPDIATYSINEQFHILENVDKVCHIPYDSIGLHFQSNLSKENICFIDTPGVNNAVDVKHKQITMDAISDNLYDLLIYISNCQYFGTNDEKILLERIIKHCRKPIVFVLNQLDNFNPEEDSVLRMLSDFENDLKALGVKKPIVIPTSAYVALLIKSESNNVYKQNYVRYYKERFSDEFFDLPLYSTCKKSLTILDKTGITLLEDTIIKTIFK